jgi:NitT/TauT family transport system permease protein
VSYGRDGVGALAALLLLLGLALPLGAAGWWFGNPGPLVAVLVALVAAIWCARQAPQGLAAGLVVSAALVIGALGPLALVTDAGALDSSALGGAAIGLWTVVLGLGLLAWRAMALLAGVEGERLLAGLVAILVPLLFGAWLIYLWQMLTVGFGVPPVLLPPPSAIVGIMSGALGTMAADFHQTFIKSVLPGWLMGCGAGFAVAVLVDRVPFLQRGLLPLGHFVSAIPIVGIAPIMVMWFGFDWHSKAAVVVIMTFFPMLVNTIAGLAAAGAMERDLMRSYAASYAQTLLRLRLPGALPFIFNALKINSTLALIGAIVAEFFGTPIVGMGFRISTEIGRMSLDMVWAEITVAAVAGSVFYGTVALAERTATFWHPSIRGGH